MSAGPYVDRLSVSVETADRARALVRVPFQDGNSNPGGARRGGAVAALIDTTGAMAAWSLVPLDPRNKASTPALHVMHHAPGDGEAVEAEGRTLRRTDELFHNTVTVRGASSGRLVSSGTVLYRIVVPAERAGRT
jgi:uncharacterized protein (TIGR00369 family)